MPVFWFWVAVILLVLWLSERTAEEDSYDEGYQDAYLIVRGKILDTFHDTESLSKADAEQLLSADTLETEDQPVAEEQLAPVQQQSLTRVQEQPEKALSPEEKERKTLQNLNTVLYMGSFLLVAAAATLIAAAVPVAVRLGILILVTILFYVAGIVLYKSSERLRPAAIAFVGTGLAILPFIGVALSLIGGVSGDVSWLLISLVGLIAYLYAAVVLQSQVVSYLTLAFVLSLTSSAVATASLPIVWYFIALIGVGLIASSISILRPQLLPVVFRQPVEQAGQVVTPITLFASFFVADQLGLFGLQIVFGITTAHYLVSWLQQRTYLYETIARVLLHSTALLFAWDIAGGDTVLFGIGWLLLWLLQAAYSYVRISYTDARYNQNEANWLAIVVAGLVFGMLFWLGSVEQALWTTYSLISIVAVATGALYRLRDVRWGYVVLVTSIPLLLTLGKALATPAWSWQVFAVIFAVLASGALVALKLAQQYDRPKSEAQLFGVALLVYVPALVITGLLTVDAVVAGWSAAIAAGLLVVYSYAIKRVHPEVLAAVLVPLTLGLWLSETSIATIWYWTVLVLGSAVIAIFATLFHHVRGEIMRRDSMLAVSQVFILGLGIGATAGDTAVTATSVVLLLVATFVSFGLRIAVRDKINSLVDQLRIGYVMYLVFAWLVSFALVGTGWPVLVYVVAAILFWIVSYAENKPWTVLIGNAALVAAIALLWNWLEFSLLWREFGVIWIAAAVLYGIYWLMLERGDQWRATASIGSVWVLLAFAVALNVFESNTLLQFASATTLLLGAATAIVHGIYTREKRLMEGGIYIATLGAQLLFALAIPEANFVFYAHWWAITLALVAWWQSTYRKERLLVSVGFITLSTGLFALGTGGWYQLLFLVEHLILLAIGAIYNKRWAIWWGVAASSLAVLYFLRDFVYLWLALLGLGLIALVIWRLSVIGKSKV